MDDVFEDAWPEEIWPETLGDCPPPRRWPNDTVDGPMSPVQQQHYDQILAAAGIPPGELSDTARLVLRWVAAGDSTVCGGLVELLERVRESDLEEADAFTMYPLYGAGETVAVTVTVGELADRGLPDGAIGVAWTDRDECVSHAVDQARHRPAWEANLRGIVLFAGHAVDCRECRRE
jgi:hypothetical protein